MKATKKIVGAACALVAAVALSAGSTFAWFTSNKAVSANGLSINVETDNSYLIIAADTSGLSAGEKLLTLAPTNNNANLLPSAYKNPEGTDPTKEGGTDSGPSIFTESTWYTAQGTTSSDGSINNETKKTLDSEGYDFADYVVQSDIVVSVSVGSTGVENVNAVMEVTKKDNAKTSPVNVVFLYQVVAASGEGFGTPSADAWTKVDVLATTGFGSKGLDLGGVASSNAHIAIKVMVYMDGNNADVKTTNSANLTGVSINFKFENKAAASGS